MVSSYWAVEASDRALRAAALETIEGLGQAKSQAIEQFMTDRVGQVERISMLVSPDLEIVEQALADLPQTTTGELSDPQEGQSEEGAESAPTRGPPGAPLADGDEAKIAAIRDSVAVAPLDHPELNEEAEAARAVLRKTLGLLLSDQRDYEELLVIDASGVVVVSTFDAHEGKSAASIEYFQDGLGSTSVQPVFLSPITERLTMVISTPIKAEDQRAIGVLAARLNLDTFFRLIGDVTGLGETGESVVVKKIANEFVFMAPTRHDGQAALVRKIALGSNTARSAREAAHGRSGSGPATDYRGVEVVAAWQPVELLDWGLVVKVDAEEVQRAGAEVRNRTMLLMLGLLALIALCSALVSARLVRPLLELKTATERISLGDLDVKLNIRTRDEVGELADSFERMAAAIKFFKRDPEQELEGPS